MTLEIPLENRPARVTSYTPFIYIRKRHDEKIRTKTGINQGARVTVPTFLSKFLRYIVGIVDWNTEQSDILVSFETALENTSSTSLIRLNSI